MDSSGDTMTIDELLSWAEDHARRAPSDEHETAIEESLSSIAYSLLALAKMKRQDQT
jgi:hypothetical protein